MPEVKGETVPKKKFKQYRESQAIRLGYLHIDIAEVRTLPSPTGGEGKLYLFVAIDRTSKVCYAELHEQARRATACDFLRAVIEAFPGQVANVVGW